MRDRLIFIISLVLVVLGVSYLGYTAYKFFTRNSTPSTQDRTPTDEGVTSTSNLELVGISNKEIIVENPKEGDKVSISIEVKNNTEDRVSSNFEGRVYKIEELFTFPNVDSELPLDVRTIPVSVNAKSVVEYSYDYSIKECGNFFIALGSDEYWKTGRGLVSYGYYNVSCSDQKAEISITPAPSVMKEKVAELPKAGPADTLILLGLVSALFGLVIRLKMR